MNVIVLTTGISGSSVLTGLLAKAGLWVGDETVFKDNITGKYETFENRKLVDLNESLIQAAGITFEAKKRYDPDARNQFAALADNIDTAPYTDFIKECDGHAPWIWKDPRLFLTIGFWKNLLELDQVKFIVIYRNPYELWKSQTNKRIIYSYRYLKDSEAQSRKELLEYLGEQGIDYHLIEYDQFTQQPAAQIAKLNDYCNVTLSMDDWQGLYRETPAMDRYKRALMAYLIYFKNYGDRIR